MFHGTPLLHCITRHMSVIIVLQNNPICYSLLCSSHRCHLDAPLWSYTLSQVLNLLELLEMENQSTHHNGSLQMAARCHPKP